MFTKTLALALMLVPAAAYAAETDHYTLGDSEIKDITYELNEYANNSVEKVLYRLNLEGGCSAYPEKESSGFSGYEADNFSRPETSEEKLYDGLRGIFANHGKSLLINDLLDGNLPRTVIPLKESVYGDWSVSNGLLLGRSGAAKSPLALSPLIKVGGRVIGVDKLEHMFGMGFAYFRRHHIKGMNLKRVLRIGVAAEKTYLGGNFLATGVFTYADLSANFNGMRFWNHMLQKQDDVLGKAHNLGPYITCENGKWQRNRARPIDFSKYVDMSMQENVNCSKFATREGVEKFKGSLTRLQLKHGKSRGFACPVSQAALEEAASKYMVPMKGGDSIDHWIINRDGNTTVSYFNEF